MRYRPEFLVCSFAAATAWLAGCSSSNGGPMVPADAAQGADRGGEGGTPADLGGNDGAPPACAAAAGFVVAAPACNTIANAAAAVPFSQGSGTAPIPAGGTIRDGLYHATRAEGFGGGTPSGRRLTLVVLEGATRFLLAGDVLDAAGVQTTSSFRVNATTAVSGTQVNFTTICMSGPSSPLPPALDFTATADTLVMSLASATGTAVTTYTRQGCP